MSDDKQLILDALALLPSKCQYHGENLRPRAATWLDNGICCDTGERAAAKGEALAALQRLLVRSVRAEGTES